MQLMSRVQCRMSNAECLIVNLLSELSSGVLPVLFFYNSYSQIANFRAFSCLIIDQLCPRKQGLLKGNKVWKAYILLWSPLLSSGDAVFLLRCTECKTSPGLAAEKAGVVFISCQVSVIGRCENRSGSAQDKIFLHHLERAFTLIASTHQGQKTRISLPERRNDTLYCGGHYFYFSSSSAELSLSAGSPALYLWVFTRRKQVKIRVHLG